MRFKFLALAAGIIILSLFPIFQTNTYYIHMVERILIYSILLFGLDIVVGYTGQVSLGHAGLFGVGAYTAGILYFKLGVPFFNYSSNSRHCLLSFWSITCITRS